MVTSRHFLYVFREIARRMNSFLNNYTMIGRQKLIGDELDSDSSDALDEFYKVDLFIMYSIGFLIFFHSATVNVSIFFSWLTSMMKDFPAF